MKKIIYITLFLFANFSFAGDKNPLNLKLIISGVKEPYTVNLNGFQFVNTKSIALTYFSNSTGPDNLRIECSKVSPDTVYFYIADIEELQIYKQWQVVLDKPVYEEKFLSAFPAKGIMKSWENSDLLKVPDEKDRNEIISIFLQYQRALSNADSIQAFSKKYFSPNRAFLKAYADSVIPFNVPAEIQSQVEYFKSVELKSSEFCAPEQLEFLYDKAFPRIVNLVHRESKPLMKISSTAYQTDIVYCLYFIKNHDEWQLY